MNCGDPTPGEYCPTCGQRKVDVRVSVRTLATEMLQDQFILDKRLPRTLGSLLFRPGHLTVEHINGRIVRYIHPFRLYLVSSILFFVLLSFFSLQLVRRALDREDLVVGAVADRNVDEALAELRLEMADTTRGADDLAALREAEAQLVERQRQVRLDSAATTIADLTAALERVDAQAGDTAIPAPVRSALERNRTLIESELAAASSHREALLADTITPDTAAPAGPVTARADRPLREVFGWEQGNAPEIQLGLFPAADSAVEAQVRRIGEMNARQAAETLLGTFFNYVPTMMFILLPVFAGVLKLLYVRRRRFYAEHFVFLLHVHSMVFILAAVTLLTRKLVGAWVGVALIGWVLVYIYLAIRRVYGQGWLKTFMKYWTLGWAYFWILALSVPLVLVATLLLF